MALALLLDLSEDESKSAVIFLCCSGHILDHSRMDADI